jgi:hypothetical protein
VRPRTFICGSPYHLGDQFIASRLDSFERRIEFRRLKDQGREAVVLDRVVCHACLVAEVTDRRSQADSKTQRLFG